MNDAQEVRMYNDMPDWQAAEKAEEEVERLGKVIAELKAENAELRDMVGEESAFDTQVAIDKHNERLAEEE